MKNQAYRMSMLYDFYGEVLTQRQQEFYDLYYNEDLSLGEIAENSGISRQGVRDVIVRAEDTLTELEEKTGLMRRFLAVRTQLEDIETKSTELLTICKQFDSPRLEQLATQIRSGIQSLQKE